MKQEKIKPRKKTKDSLYDMERATEIRKKLNSCFGEHSLSLKDQMECCWNARELDKIPKGKHLFWVEFYVEDWCGAGSGSSEIFPHLNKAKEWILKKIREDNLQIGVTRFRIYPVYRVERRKN